MAWRGSVRHGVAGCGETGQGKDNAVRCRWVCQGKFGWGLAWRGKDNAVWYGKASLDHAGRGKVR